MLLPIVAAAACSQMPSRDWPSHEQRTVVAEYDAQAAPIELPQSSETLTVLALRVEPEDLRESWQEGRRWVHPRTDAARVRVTCTYRAYAKAGAIPTPAELFRGAASLTVKP